MAKFKWVAPSQEDLDRENKAQKEQRGGLYDSYIKPEYSTYKNRTGDNRLRIMPPTFGTRKHFGYPIFIHFGVGPNNSAYLCADRMYNKPCAVCDECLALRREGDNDAANKMKVTTYYIAWVIDRQADDDIGPVIFRYGYKMGASIATVSLDEDTGRTICIFDPYKGYDLSFTKEEKGGDAKNVDYIGHRLSRRESPIHRDEQLQEKWLEYINDNPLPDCLQSYDYDHIARYFKGQVPTVRDDEDEEVQERTSRGRPSLREDLDDEIPEHAGGNNAGEMTNGEDDNPPFDPDTGEIKEPEERPREETRQRPRLATEERGRGRSEASVQERASGAVSRLRERVGRR